MSPLLWAAAMARTVKIDTLSNGGDVLVLAPHPDDETLGCGAAICALTDLGRRAQVIVVTDGARSHPASRSHPPERLRQVRTAEVHRAVAILTAGRGPAPIMLDYPDTHAPDDDAARDAAIDRILSCARPTTAAVWSAWGGDPHLDHARTARLAARLVARNPELAHWSYPIWGRFDPVGCHFDPDAMVLFGTDGWQACKAAAIAAHASQMTGLIADDPYGFRMTDAHQRHFLSTPEIFLRESTG